MISIIVAMDRNNGIGYQNTLPFKQRNDMQRFKALTYGKTVIMGRKTFESMGSRPLPNRVNVILTKNSHQLKCNDLDVGTATDAVFPLYKSGDREAFVIGGGEIYELAMPFAEKLYVTKVRCEIAEADAFFPEIDSKVWKCISTEMHNQDVSNRYYYEYLTYVRT